jgi:uncharacterized protein (TIGR04255 family)
MRCVEGQASCGPGARPDADYPGVQFLPPLPPQVEVVPGSPAFSPPFLGFPPLPRVLFVSGDDASLVQLQRDRLYFNWRTRRLSEYPHYASFRDAFSRIYTAFEGFLADEGIGSIQPFQCDILYVNSLSVETTGTKPSSPEKVFRCWNTALGEEWQTPLEDISFNSRYRLVDENDQPFGRLLLKLV